MNQKEVNKMKKKADKLPFPDTSKPCRTTKRDRSSNVLKRLGTAGAINFYRSQIITLNGIIEAAELIKGGALRRWSEMNSYDREIQATVYQQKVRNEFWIWNRRLQKAKTKLERYKRFLSNIENDQSNQHKEG